MIKSISPGAVKTEIAIAAGMDPKIIEQAYKTIPFLDSKDVSQAVVYALSTKPHVQVFYYNEKQYKNIIFALILGS